MFKLRSKKKKRLYFWTMILLLILLGLTLYFFFVYFRIEELLSTEGYIQMELDKLAIIGDNTVVIMKNGCNELNFYISHYQGFAISEGTLNTVKYRPSTHDIIVDIMQGFGIKPVMVKITRMSEGTYFAELILQQFNNFLILDIRPSDATAIAVRTNIPIFVNENLVTKIC